MKFYDLNTEFTFGKFEGSTVRQIIDLQHSYLDWCAINLDHFYITETLIEAIKKNTTRLYNISRRTTKVIG